MKKTKKSFPKTATEPHISIINKGFPAPVLFWFQMAVIQLIRTQVIWLLSFLYKSTFDSFYSTKLALENKSVQSIKNHLVTLTNTYTLNFTCFLKHFIGTRLENIQANNIYIKDNNEKDHPWFTSANCNGTPSPKTSLMKACLVMAPLRVAVLL